MPAASMRRILSWPTSLRRPPTRSSILTHDVGYNSRSLGCKNASSRAMTHPAGLSAVLVIIVLSLSTECLKHLLGAGSDCDAKPEGTTRRPRTTEVVTTPID